MKPIAIGDAVVFRPYGHVKVLAMLKAAAIVSFIALMLSTTSHAANISLAAHCFMEPCGYLNGEIEAGDLARLKAVFFDQKISTLQLNSPGGSLEEAMKIGRWVRQNRINIVMPMFSDCFSSCVFVLAAGNIKAVYYEAWRNKVGIHRPFLTRAPIRGSVQVAMSRALADSKAYFIEMNIPEQLADAMFSIPPDEVEILTDEKLSFYRLNQQDMVLAEESALNVATRFGMTRREYMRNKGLFEKDVKAKCYPIRKEDEGLECIRDIAKKYGLHSSQQR